MSAGKPAGPEKSNALVEIFSRGKVAIGVIHSRPLPGSPGYEGEPMEEVYAYAVEEGLSYRQAGFDGLIVENHGDIPFLKPDLLGHETAAAMAVMAERVRQKTGLPVGINVLGNGALMALSIAKAAGARFVRVNQWVNAYVANEGIIEGPAAVATRHRAMLRGKAIRIFADVHVKHGSHAITADRSLEEQVKDAEWFDADVLIVTGQRTGDPPDTQELQAIKRASSLPVVVGSGVDERNVASILSVADGCIVASSLKEGGVWWNRVDPAKARAFVAALRASDAAG
jgi:uncharacterized protein